MSPFSSRIRVEVLGEFPEWEAFFREEQWKGSEPYFVVQVPAPEAAATTLPLRISTWDEAVTVDFDYYHAHFERWKPDSGDSKHQSALLYVREIIAEHIAVASWWQETHCKLCAQHEPGAPLTPPFKISYTRVRVRSWQGSHNLESSAKPGGQADL